MEKRIELEKRGRPSNQITDLNLDNCRSTNIVGLTDEFTALETLSLINVGLTTLKGFPKLPKLKKLELSDNRISTGLSNLTTSAPELTHLNLSGNKIKDLEELKPLENFKHLDSLDLFNNEATSMDSYREKIFALIPSLKFLDGYDAEEREAQSDGEDDDELNGNESEGEDENCAFSINGIEIDLKELEIYEKRLAEKRRKHPISESVTNDQTEMDDLDDYLDKLNIAATSAATSSQETKDNVSNNENTAATTSQQTKYIVSNSEQRDVGLNCNDTERNHQISFPLLLYGVMSILFALSTAYKKNDIEIGDEEDDDDDVDEEEDDDDDEDNGDVSLADVYNDDLDEDNSDYVEEGDGEEDDDIDSDEDEANESATGQPQAPAAEESPARGKKRKHDG